MNFSNVQKIVYLLFVLSSLLLGNWAQAESRLALVIGNGAYPDKKQGINDVAALTNPKYDAEDMAELLQNSGFTLVDDAGRNLPLIDGTKQQMDAAVDKFLEKLNRTPDAVAWFYYSGHGVYLKDVKRPSESANYLLPVGHNFRADDAAGIKYYAVNAHELKDRLQNTPVKNRLMIFDACRQKLELSESKGFGAGDEFRPMDPEHGLMVVHATLHSYLSFGNPNERNSNFTKYLLAALKQQTSKYITQAISFGILQVTAANKSLDEKHHQHPRVEGLLSEDFCLAGCGSAVKEVTVLPRLQNRRALVIGNNDYPNEMNLSSPINEAIDVADALDNLGFKVSLLTNASKSEMSKAVQKFANELNNNDIVIFYFSGHGFSDKYANENERDTNFLVGSFQERASRSSFNLNPVKKESIDESFVVKNLRYKNPNGVNIIILEASPLADPEIHEQFVISHAAQPLKDAFSHPQRRNSIYTESLLEALKDRNLTSKNITEFFNEVGLMVYKSSENKQLPLLKTFPLKFCLTECSQ